MSVKDDSVVMKTRRWRDNDGPGTQRTDGQLLSKVTLEPNISLPTSETSTESYVLYEQRELKKKHTNDNMEEANCIENVYNYDPTA